MLVSYCSVNDIVAWVYSIYFIQLGFKWSRHKQVRFNIDLLRHITQNLYTIKWLDGCEQNEISKKWMMKY